MGPSRKKGERLHDYPQRVQCNVRELAKQTQRLPDEVQGFLLLHQADLSTQARIAIMTLASNSLYLGDEFLRYPKEHDARAPRTVCATQAKEASVSAGEQEGDSDVRTAPAALAGECDIDLEETDVQEILLAYKESRQLRGEQRVNHGYRPVTGRNSEERRYRVEDPLNIKELISRTRCRICREKGANVQTKENKCPETVKR